MVSFPCNNTEGPREGLPQQQYPQSILVIVNKPLDSHWCQELFLANEAFLAETLAIVVDSVLNTNKKYSDKKLLAIIYAAGFTCGSQATIAKILGEEHVV